MDTKKSNVTLVSSKPGSEPAKRPLEDSTASVETKPVTNGIDEAGSCKAESHSVREDDRDEEKTPSTNSMSEKDKISRDMSNAGSQSDRFETVSEPIKISVTTEDNFNALVRQILYEAERRTPRQMYDRYLLPIINQEDENLDVLDVPRAISVENQHCEVPMLPKKTPKIANYNVSSSASVSTGGQRSRTENMKVDNEMSEGQTISYPEWPAMVDCDATGRYADYDEQTGEVLRYFVVFLDPKTPTRQRIQPHKIRKFVSGDEVKQTRTWARHYTRLFLAAKEAENALTLSLEVKAKGLWVLAKGLRVEAKGLRVLAKD
ncbi:unnamed protein product [Echinostoma caproni]|uniref:Sin3a_C domain-containing protein n=1 Tax=Echinostoma caproni TaxID=27848 RepID=A0A183AJA4_9TREM|nr:unnamed protein product [Echinostoma caproni]